MKLNLVVWNQIKGGVWYKMKLNQVVCNRVELHLNLMWCGIQMKLNQVFIREKV